MSIVVFRSVLFFVIKSNRSYWERNDCLNIKICKCLVWKMCNFQVGGILMWQFKGFKYITKAL